MIIRILSTALVTLILHTFVYANPSQTSSDTEKVKLSIRKIYAVKQPQVEIKLRDKTKMRGYISDIGEDTFVLTDSRTGKATTISYSNVVQVRQQRLSKRGQTIASIAFLVGIVVIAALSSGDR